MAQPKDEEVYRKIMRLQPSLIKLLVAHAKSPVEAVKLSVLRIIEFLIDNLGCSLDTYLVHILGVIISTYNVDGEISGGGFFQ